MSRVLTIVLHLLSIILWKVKKDLEGNQSPLRILSRKKSTAKRTIDHPRKKDSGRNILSCKQQERWTEWCSRRRCGWATRPLVQDQIWCATSISTVKDSNDWNSKAESSTKNNKKAFNNSCRANGIVSRQYFEWIRTQW